MTGESVTLSLIAVLEKIDEKCMTLIIGIAEESKEEDQRIGDSKKSVEQVVSMYLNGPVYVQMIRMFLDFRLPLRVAWIQDHELAHRGSHHKIFPKFSYRINLFYAHPPLIL
jgi:hypothetical protein